ncbi:MAG: AAA family ATPase, partial [Gammaproteobacteria bacterium]|nr:AAA family ATPase [Gammaproteobacteria bacterium]
MDRHYKHLIHELLGLFPCVAIIGARQCGKTTLLKTLPSSWRIFDLEKASDMDLVARDPDLFLRLYPDNIAIDECQNLPALFPALRVAIDGQRDRPGRFVITGSSSPTLIRAISESLAGRIAIVELAPFSAPEAFSLPPSEFFPMIADACGKDDLLTLHPRLDIAELHTFWFRGGYPEPWVKDQTRFT